MTIILQIEVSKYRTLYHQYMWWRLYIVSAILIGRDNLHLPKDLPRHFFIFDMPVRLSLLFLNTHTPTKFHLRLYSTSHTHTLYHPPFRKGSLLVRWSLLLEANDGSLLRLRSSMFDATEGVWLCCLSPFLDCSKNERKAVIRDDKLLISWLPWECSVMICLEDEPWVSWERLVLEKLHTCGTDKY